MNSTALGLELSHSILVESPRFERVLAALRHWDSINAGHHVEKRTSERFEFLGHPVVRMELPTRPDGSRVVPSGAISFYVWGRNISRGGICFLTSRELVPTRACDSTPIIRLEEDVLRVALPVVVGLWMEDETELLVDSQLVRFRRVQDGLLECGVQFRRKLDALPHLLHEPYGLKAK